MQNSFIEWLRWCIERLGTFTSQLNGLTERMDDIEIINDGVREAPSDGIQYARKNQAWEKVEEFDDAPSNGRQYVRCDEKWTEYTPARLHFRGEYESIEELDDVDEIFESGDYVLAGALGERAYYYWHPVRHVWLEGLESGSLDATEIVAKYDSYPTSEVKSKVDQDDFDYQFQTLLEEVAAVINQVISMINAAREYSDMLYDDSVADMTAFSQIVNLQLQGKLDRNISDTWSVYAKGGTGDVQLMKKFDLNANAGTLAERDTGGALRVGTATASNHAVTKAQMDAIPKLPSNPASYRIVATGSAANVYTTVQYADAAQGGTIPRRKAYGEIEVGAPRMANDAVPMSYLEVNYSKTSTYVIPLGAFSNYQTREVALPSTYTNVIYRAFVDKRISNIGVIHYSTQSGYTHEVSKHRGNEFKLFCRASNNVTVWSINFNNYPTTAYFTFTMVN